ncbi:alpha/beta hydrolase [Hymenobacter qilianensis]|uniref:Alpha/beta hydrolase n=1 Tax=Hymenobacter qilianensis TaxID=1385715 RepID=A0A7H0GY50_9BACT|nr:alpha/beta hydrolase [Hymenobacter qilianensis]QNP53216.1 alpha/beta hydrolase [Hymenobacter qilianensis]
MFYLIPGLGADARVFQKLRPLLHGPSQVLEWLKPIGDEPLPDYVRHMAAVIPEDADCFVVGVSFGGVIAQEICRIRPRACAVLVSSIPDADRLPTLLRIIRATRVYKLVPPPLLKLFPWAGRWYFGIDDNVEYKVFKAILRDMDSAYTSWAIRRLLHWDSTGVGSCVQILGSRDRVFPPSPAPSTILFPVAPTLWFLRTLTR